MWKDIWAASTKIIALYYLYNHFAEKKSLIPNPETKDTRTAPNPNSKTES